MADGLRISIGTLYHHYESRQRLLRVLSYRAGMALMEAADDDLGPLGVASLLRADEDGRMLTRAWLGIVELGRCEEHVGHSVAAVLERERSSLIIATDHQVRDPTALELLQAYVHGLRTATERFCDPLDIDVAREMLRAQTALVLAAA